MIAPSRRTMTSECSAQNSLARRGRRSGVRPGAFEIEVAERQELLPFRLAKRGRTPRAIIAAMSPSIRAMACRKPRSIGAPTRCGDEEEADWLDQQHRTGGGRERPHSGDLLQGEFQLPCSAVVVSLDWASMALTAASRPRWPQDAQHLVGDRRVDAQATHTEMHRFAPMVHARAIAVIATELAAVVHMEFAAAMAAAQKPRQQQLPFTGRPASRRAQLMPRSHCCG